MLPIIKNLLNSRNPSVRYKTITLLLGRDDDDPEVTEVRNLIKSAPMTKALLSIREKDGTIPVNVYSKWYGAHWTLYSLAVLDYPPGDKKLKPLVKQVHDWLFSNRHAKNIRDIRGRIRRCASQEANALWSAYKLGLTEKRTDELAERLCRWQWEDGGWNCDKRPEVEISSYRETITPARALCYHCRMTGNDDSKKAVERIAELFLKRKIFRRLCDNEIMRPSFVQIHYPRYFEYDYLHALLFLAEAGFIKDERCTEALDLLEKKRLPDGGWPCERVIYSKAGGRQTNRISYADWGGRSKTKMHELVTVEALYVLKESGRLDLN